MPVRTLSEDLKLQALKEINEDPARIQENLEYIKEWLKKQPHINARTDDQWLLAFLRGCKFSLERTKEKLDLFYTMRTMIPEYFNNRDPMHEDMLAAIQLGVFLPLWNTGSRIEPRIIIIRSGVYDPQKYSFQQIIKANLMLLDILFLEDDVALINGFCIIQDMAGVTLAHMPSPAIIKKTMICFQDSYPNRIKGIHMINTSGYFEVIFGMIKPFLTEKIKSRVHVYGSDISSLYKTVPQKYLPQEYGGNGESIQTIIDSCVNKFEEYKYWFKEDEQFKTNELKRPGKPKTSDELFGVEGSFRKLNVD